MSVVTAADIVEQLAKVSLPYFTLSLADEHSEHDVEFATSDLEIDGASLILDVEPAEYEGREQRFRITVEEM